VLETSRKLVIASGKTLLSEAIKVEKLYWLRQNSIVLLHACCETKKSLHFAPGALRSGAKIVLPFRSTAPEQPGNTPFGQMQSRQ